MKKIKIPSKKTLNLMIKVKTLAHPTRLIPILLLIVLAAAVFAKFAVINRLDQVTRAEAELTSLQRQLAMIQSVYADYDEVEAEYNRYTYQNFDRTIPDRLDVLALVERELFPISTVQSISVSGRVLSLTVTGLTLEQTSDMIASLKLDPLVESVFVSTSVNNEKDNYNDTSSITTMTITLVDATTLKSETEEDEDENAEDEDSGEDEGEDSEDDGDENGGAE